MKFPSFLFLSFIGTFFTLTNCNQDLPSLRSVQDTFPENHFCKSSPFKVVSGEPGFIAQCGLQAMKILRLVAKRNHRTDLGESFKQSYAEFADKLSQMTYTVSKWRDQYSDIGVSFYKARRRCQVCGGHLATEKEMRLYQSVSDALQLINSPTVSSKLDSTIGYWMGDLTENRYKISLCPTWNTTNPEWKADCVHPRDFVCTFYTTMKEECFNETRVCTSPWREGLPGCGCPYHSSMRPPHVKHQPVSKRSHVPSTNERGSAFLSAKSSNVNSSVEAEITKRVVGGKTVHSADKWPFFVEIGTCDSKCIPLTGTPDLDCGVKVAEKLCESKSIEHRCGGVIIGKYWVLTAAHCFQGREWQPAKFFVATGTTLPANNGSFTGDIFSVRLIKVHPQYVNTFGVLENDLALVKIVGIKLCLGLRVPVTLLQFHLGSAKGRPMQVCLPQKDTNKLLPGDEATFVGMGRLESMDRELQRPLSDVSLSVVDCNPGSDSRDDSSICAGDSSSNVCNGDSGGALLCDNVDGSFHVCGIVSHSRYGVRSCRSQPGVFANVSYYLEWIKETMENDSDQSEIPIFNDESSANLYYGC